MTGWPAFYSAAVARAEALGTEWREDAACKRHDPALFFPDTGPGVRLDFEPALAICRSCPVIDACYRWAVAAKEIKKGHAVHGVVAGVAPKTRGRDLEPCGTRAAYERHQRAGDAPCVPCAKAKARYDADKWRRSRAG